MGNGEKHRDKSWLKQQIEDENRSLQEVGQEVDKSAQTIRYWVDKFDLDLHWKHSNIKDERDNQYGDVRVKELSHINENGSAVWLCEHKEGYKFEAVGRQLRQGNISGIHSKPEGQSAFECIYRRYKRNAKSRDLVF